MRPPDDIRRMIRDDTTVGMTAHYPTMARFINERGFKKGIEIGVAYAGNAYHLLTNTALELLVGIDPYEYYKDMPGLECQEDYDTLFVCMMERMEPFIKEGRFLSVRLKSEYAVPLFPLGDMDFVFIDGDHKFDTIRMECRQYSRFIREGGCLMGHDWGIFEEVKEAVTFYADEIKKPIHILSPNIWAINL